MKTHHSDRPTPAPSPALSHFSGGLADASQWAEVGEDKGVALALCDNMRMRMRSQPCARAASRGHDRRAAIAFGARVWRRGRHLRAGAGGLARFGKVLQEKAKADWDRVFRGNEKTREKLGVVDELLGYWNVEESEDVLEELEDALIVSDFGPAASARLVDAIREKIKVGAIKDQGALREELKANMTATLEGAAAQSGQFAMNEGDGPTVILIVGVNGGGKTTTVGKLSSRFCDSGARVALAAGDTFRAAAKEQLEVWAERTGARMAAYPPGEKPGPIDVLGCALDDALARARDGDGDDVLICDTSGRLHNNYELMDEIEKCKKTLADRMPGAPHETLLVLDGTTGLNMLNQARDFHEYIGVTGLILTKLDGTARGGAIMGVVEELGLPIKFIGVGESVEDLQPFDAAAFVNAILA